MLTWFHNRVEPHMNTDGFWYSLAFGTLLGSARDGDMMDWDEDMDIAVPQDKIPWLMQLLKDAAMEEHPPYDVTSDSYSGQSSVDNIGGVRVETVPVMRLHMSSVNDAHIDIWPAVGFASPFPSTMTETPVQVGIRTSPNYGAFPLQKCKLGNKEFPCFGQKEKFLENWYGDTWTQVDSYHAL